MKATKLRIYPRLAQRRQLTREFQARRFVWNWALGRRSKAWRDEKLSLNAVALSRELTCLKTSTPFLGAASATVLNNTLWDLDSAYAKFFKKHGRYPRFKKRGTVQSVCYQLDKRQAVFRDGEYLRLPKLGPVETVWSASIPVIPNSATVSRTPDGKWYLALQYEAEDRIDTPAPRHDLVGLDFGITTLVATSREEKLNGRKPFKKSKRKLRFAQRRLAKARKSGTNRRKLKCRVARIHQRIGDQRRDFLHKLSTKIARENQAIGIEDLHMRGMMANGKLASAVADCGWHELRRQLTYKAQWYGRKLIVIGRFDPTSKVCSGCGHVLEGKLPLSLRSWMCPSCGAEHDRDINAAKVIAHLAAKYREERGNLCLLTEKTPENSGASRDGTAWDDAGKAQLGRPQGRGQRTPRFQGALS